MRPEGEKTMHKDARFWALWAAIWLGLYLSVVNIIAKIDLLARLAG